MTNTLQASSYRVFDLTTQVGAPVSWTLIALVTFVDVLGRELFSAPIPGGYEIIQCLMVVGVFCSMPIVALRQGHVRVDLLYHALPPRLVQVVDFVSRIAAVAFFALLAWSMAKLYGHALHTGERSVYLHVPHWAVALVMTVFLIFTTLCCLIASKAQAEDANSAKDL
jgi:TRAP-type C4-dicarboxylate transport system permease small subunit